MHVHMETSDMRAFNALICDRANARYIMICVADTGTHLPRWLLKSVFYHVNNCCHSMYHKVAKTTRRSCSCALRRKKKELMSTMLWALSRACLSTSHWVRLNTSMKIKQNNMLGLNTGPTNAGLRTARRHDKGAKACKQPLLTNCLHFLNNFYFTKPEVSKKM